MLSNCLSNSCPTHPPTLRERNTSPKGSAGQQIFGIGNPKNHFSHHLPLDYETRTVYSQTDSKKQMYRFLTTFICGTSLSLLASACSSDATIKLNDGSKLTVKKENVNCVERLSLDGVSKSWRCSAAGVITSLSGRTRDWNGTSACYTAYSDVALGGIYSDSSEYEDLDNTTITRNPEGRDNYLPCIAVLETGYKYK